MNAPSTSIMPQRMEEGSKWEFLEAAGLRRLGPHPDDNLSVYVELPPGWQIIPSEHPNYTRLVDDNGGIRAVMSYGLDIFDQKPRASVHTYGRYTTRRIEDGTHSYFQVLDGDKVLYTTAVIDQPGKNPSTQDLVMFYGEQAVLRDDAYAWLGREFPHYKDHSFYWGRESHIKSPQSKVVDTRIFLPKRMWEGSQWKQLEDAGIRRLEDHEDSLFVYVELPAGWQKQPIENSRGSLLLDDKGGIRAHIYYGAVLDDREAYIETWGRYTATGVENAGVFYVEVRDGQNGAQKVLYTTAVINQRPGAPPAEYYSTINVGRKRRLYKQARNWLSKHFPDWENVSAYWENDLQTAA